MESSTPARVLVVAHRTAATTGLRDAVRHRAAAGPARFTLLVPRTAHGLHRLMDPEDTDDSEAREILDRALPLLSERRRVAGRRADRRPGAADRDRRRDQPRDLRRDHPLDAADPPLALAAARPPAQGRRARAPGDDGHGDGERVGGRLTPRAGRACARGTRGRTPRRSSPPATIHRRLADVAQLVEHFTRNEGVPGSSPGVGLGRGRSTAIARPRLVA